MKKMGDFSACHVIVFRGGYLLYIWVLLSTYVRLSWALHPPSWSLKNSPRDLCCLVGFGVGYLIYRGESRWIATPNFGGDLSGAMINQLPWEWLAIYPFQVAYIPIISGKMLVSWESKVPPPPTKATFTPKKLPAL